MKKYPKKQQTKLQKLTPQPPPLGGGLVIHRSAILQTKEENTPSLLMADGAAKQKNRNTHLLPLGEKQRAKTSSKALRST